jgi:hypothetical protein
MNLMDWVREKVHPEGGNEATSTVEYKARYAEMIYTERRQREIANRLRKLEVEAEILARKKD